MALKGEIDNRGGGALLTSDKHFLVLRGGVNAAFPLAANQGGNGGGDPRGKPVHLTHGPHHRAFDAFTHMFDLLHRGANGLVDLFHPVACHIARVVNQFADPFHLFPAGAHNVRRLPWTCLSGRAGHPA